MPSINYLCYNPNETNWQGTDLVCQFLWMNLSVPSILVDEYFLFFLCTFFLDMCYAING